MSDPHLLSIRSPSDVFNYVKALLTNPRYFTTLAALVILGDVVLTQLVIRFIACTCTLRWLRGSKLTTCSLQTLRLTGRRTYTSWSCIWVERQIMARLRDQQGLSCAWTLDWTCHPSPDHCYYRYPAGHILIHHLLYLVTDAGKNIARAQQIYGGLYIATLALTCAIYGQAGGIPNWVLLLLPLSKRLHSIFMLRLFNDCWSVFAAQGAILAYGAGEDLLGTLFFR